MEFEERITFDSTGELAECTAIMTKLFGANLSPGGDIQPGRASMNPPAEISVFRFDCLPPGARDRYREACEYLIL